MANIIDIDKSLDKFSEDFSVRHTRNRMAFALALICILPYVLSVAVPSLSDGGFASFATTMLAFGVVVLIVLVAYYFIGDSRKPYFKPSHEWMERCVIYIDERNISEIADMLSRGDFGSIASIPRKHSQQYLIIMYKAPKSNVICAQIAQSLDGHYIPKGDILMFKDGEHNVPKDKRLLDFFYKDCDN